MVHQPGFFFLTEQFIPENFVHPSTTLHPTSGQPLTIPQHGRSIAWSSLPLLMERQDVFNIVAVFKVCASVSTSVVFMEIRFLGPRLCIFKLVLSPTKSPSRRSRPENPCSLWMLCSSAPAFTNMLIFWLVLQLILASCYFDLHSIKIQDVEPPSLTSLAFSSSVIYLFIIVLLCLFFFF